MSFKETLAKKYAESYLKKYGDRLTQIQGHVLSVKITTKTILWIYNVLKVDVVVKPERSKAVIRSQYVRKQWFKKPAFMDLKQGNMVVIQGLKGKKNKKNPDNAEVLQIINIRNMTTKKDLVGADQKVQKVQQRQYIK